MDYIVHGVERVGHDRATFIKKQNKTKLSCNRDVTLGHSFRFLLWQDRTKEMTHSPDMLIFA